MSGRKAIYTTTEELEEAKKLYNKRYYEKKRSELKAIRDAKRKYIKNNIQYTDDQLLEIINHVGHDRILKLLI